MKFTLLQENLLPKIQDALRFTAIKSQLPVLSGIYFQCREGETILRATDLKVGFQASVGGKITTEGECVVPARVLVELVSSLQPGPIEIEADDSTLHLSQGKVKVKLDTFPIADFPPFPALGEVTCTVPLKEFSNAIERVIYAASLDEMRPVLASILFQIKDGEFRTACTDGYRLAVSSFSIIEEGVFESVLIQAKAAAEIARIIAKEKGKEVRFFVSRELAQASFVNGDCMITVRITEGEFPNFSAIIPPTFLISTTVNREEFVRALKTANVIAKESSSIISMEIKKKVIKVSSSSIHVGENSIEIDSSYAGNEERQLSCNAKFLLDMLQWGEKEQVEICVNEDLKPILLRPEKENDFTYIVMPFKK